MSDKTGDDPGILFTRCIEASIRFGMSADTRHLYAQGSPGQRYARSRPVALPPETLAHLSENDPKRPAKLQEQAALVVKAVVSPVVIYRNLRHKSTIGPWSQFHAVPDASGKDWVAVVYTLANFDVPEAMHYHRVITIMLAKRQYLFETVGGAMQLKPDYIYVRTQKESRHLSVPVPT